MSETVLVRTSDVCKRYGISPTTVWRWIKDRAMGFPKPIYISRYRYWKVAELEAWEAEREQER
jgi:predicted DNA-binding transcriptional regulator AlpA